MKNGWEAAFSAFRSETPAPKTGFTSTVTAAPCRPMRRSHDSRGISKSRCTMRNATRWIAAVGVAVIVAGVATAQPPQRGQRGGAGFGGNRASAQFLLNNEDVQKELKLTDKQKEEVKAFAPAMGGGRGQGGG